MREIVHQWLCPRGLLVGGIFQYAFTVLTMAMFIWLVAASSPQTRMYGWAYTKCAVYRPLRPAPTAVTGIDTDISIR